MNKKKKLKKEKKFEAEKEVKMAVMRTLSSIDVQSLPTDGWWTSLYWSNNSNVVRLI